MKKHRLTKNEQIKSLIEELIPLLDLDGKRYLIGKLKGEIYIRKVMKDCS